MQFDQYISDATVTESVLKGPIVVDQNKLIAVMQAFIAAGNILDVMKKDIFYGLPTDQTKLAARQLRILQNEGDLQANTISVLFDTDNPHTELTGVDTRLAHAIIGISTEAVELCEALIASITTGQPIDIINVLEELFDILWYVFIAHDATNTAVTQTLDRGFAKLKARYADKFDSARAHTRDLATERVILEGAQNS